MPTIPQATLTKKETIGTDTYEYTFSTSDTFTFKPGQYVWVILPSGMRRAFSIGSSAHLNSGFSIIFRSSNSDYKHELLTLSEQQKITFRGPLGSSFVLEENIKDGVYFIGGGVGSAPFISILRSYQSLPVKPRVSFINLNASEEKKFLTAELTDISKKRGLIFVDKLGKFEVAYLSSDNNIMTAHYFICGPQEFINDVYMKLLRIGVPEANIHFEEFYPKSDTEVGQMLSGRDNDVFDLAVQSSSDHIIITDQNGTILFANTSATKITGYTNEEMIGQTPRLWGGLMGKDFYENMWSRLKAGKPFKSEFKNIKKDGSEYNALTNISPIIGKDGSIVGYIGTEDDITQAKEIDRMKSEFVSLSAHQLRSPVSTIRWSIESMMKNKDVPINIAGHLSDVYSAVLTMNDTINLLLNVSRFELGTVQLNGSPIDLQKVVKDVLNWRHKEILTKGLKLSYSTSSNTSKIIGDEQLIRIILDNLISNAIKYTPNAGNIEISLSSQKENILFKITDSGIGIPMADQSKIFTKLFRGSNVKKVDPSGLGLGLYLVKLIIDLKGGKIWFDSNEDKGTTFFVEFPKTIKSIHK